MAYHDTYGKGIFGYEMKILMYVSIQLNFLLTISYHLAPSNTKLLIVKLDHK